MKLIEIKDKLKSLIAFGILQLYSLKSSALRATQEDIYGESSWDPLSIIVGLIIAAIFVRLIFQEKELRLALLVYAGVLGGLVVIGKIFGMDALIVACIVVGLIAWNLQSSNKNKK
jgi:predicted branched-subunit amino acid permease